MFFIWNRKQIQQMYFKSNSVIAVFLTGNPLPAQNEKKNNILKNYQKYLVFIVAAQVNTISYRNT